MVALKAIALALGVSSLGTDGFRMKAKANQTASTWRAVLRPGKMEMKRPAFMMLDEETKTVVVSQFGRATKPTTNNPLPLPAASSISKIPFSHFSNAFSRRSFSGNYGAESIYVSTNEGLKWPNKLSRTPSEYGDYIVVPDGFLPPGKSDGNIFFADSSGKVHRVTKERKGAFYHEVEWHDFNGDGLKDMLTQRVIKSGLFKFKFEGDLLWLENPGMSRFASSEWTEHVIAKGPDVIFKTVPYQGGLAVFCTEFFGKVPRISVRLVNMQGVQTDMRVIDTELGKPFAVNLADLDGDGKKELIATNHQDEYDDIKMAIFAYEVPSDLINGRYPRHTLTYNPSNIKVETPGVGSPGFAYAFHPEVGMKGAKHVICAGDGSFDVWFLRPTGRRFQYETQIVNINGTTGELLLHDFDKDGIMDVLVPDNDYWKIHGITFAQ